jgi:hypothetical protein
MNFGDPMKGAPSLLKRWLLTSGRDAVATTRASFVSVEGRAGLVVFAGLWVVGRLTVGEWSLWGPELGGETLAIVRGWYGGERVLGQAVLLVAHLLLGVVWGGIIKNAWAGIGHFWLRVRAEHFTAGLVGALTGFLILGLHGALWVRDLARHPALYQETVFASTPFGFWVHESSFLVMSNYLERVRCPWGEPYCGDCSLSFGPSDGYLVYEISPSNPNGHWGSGRRTGLIYGGGPFCCVDPGEIKRRPKRDRHFDRWVAGRSF